MEPTANLEFNTSRYSFAPALTFWGDGCEIILKSLLEIMLLTVNSKARAKETSPSGLNEELPAI